MKKYVLGFAFTEQCNKVLLMEKNSPDWQEGQRNGIGGKVERNETIRDAMCRESMEEAYLDIPWTYKALMRGSEKNERFEVHVFYSITDEVLDYKQMEDEILGIYHIDLLPWESCIANLDFLIPYFISNDNSLFLTLDYN